MEVKVREISFISLFLYNIPILDRNRTLVHTHRICKTARKKVVVPPSKTIYNVCKGHFFLIGKL